MKSDFRKILMLFSLIGLVFIGCTKKTEIDTSQKVLNIGIRGKFKGYDPIIANDYYSSMEIGRIYEGLLEFHYLKRPYELEENLAEGMPQVSDDGLTYTFKIKKGVFFQDDNAFPGGKGRELVAQDFVYSLLRNADPKLPGRGWWVFDGKIAGLNEWREAQKNNAASDYEAPVEGLKALDKYTLQFKLAKPFPQFLYALAITYSVAVPREAVEKYGDEFINHPVGTGPFKLEKPYTGTNRFTYIKNPTFRKKLYPSEASEEFKEKGFLKNAGKPLPLVDKVVVDIIVEESTQWLSFKKGKIDFLIPPKDNFNTAISPTKELNPKFLAKGINLEQVPMLDVTYIAFNHHYKLFRDNIKLRKAMSLAYNGRKANEMFYNGNGMMAHSVVPPGVKGYIKGYKNPYKEYNLEKAKKMLAEAGYPEGKGLPEITYDTSSSPTSRQMADFFKQEMSKIGIKIKVELHPFPELQKRISTRKSQTYGISWIADYPDAENFLQLLYGPNGSPGANGSNYDNPDFNKLFEKAVVLQDGPVRTALYEKLTRMAGEAVPWIFGVHRKSFVLVQGWLDNFIRSDFEHGRVQYLDVDMKNKAKLMQQY